MFLYAFTVFLRIYPAYAYNPHTPIPRTDSYFQYKKKFVQPTPSYTPHWSCEGMSSFGSCITRVTAAGGMGEGEGGREKQRRQSKQSHLKPHGHCSMHGRVFSD